jgi:drug/metabolite transporter (DMT)-like permease
LGEQLNTIQLVGIGISCVGIFILEGHRHHTKQISHDSALSGTLSHIDIPEEKRASKTKVYFVLISALIFFSSNAVLDKYIIEKHAVNPIYLLVLIQLCILLNFIILHVYTRKEKTKSSFDLSLVHQMSFWGHIFFVIVHRVTHVLALREIGVALLHTIKQFSTVLTTILGGKLFTEKHMVRRTIACVCIVTGVVLAIL